MESACYSTVEFPVASRSSTRRLFHMLLPLFRTTHNVAAANHRLNVPLDLWIVNRLMTSALDRAVDLNLLKTDAVLAAGHQQTPASKRLTFRL